MGNDPKPYFLTTSRLRFARWRESDLDRARSLWGDPAVTRYISSGGFSDDRVKARLLFELEHDRKFGVQYWPVFLRESGDFIGCCGLRAFDSEPGDLEQGIYELGFHLKPEYWGRGYAGEAARAVVAYAFDHLHLNGLFAGHHPENVNSGKLLLKLGFVPAGTQYYPPTGLEHPAYRLKNPAR